MVLLIATLPLHGGIESTHNDASSEQKILQEVMGKLSFLKKESSLEEIVESLSELKCLMG